MDEILQNLTVLLSDDIFNPEIDSYDKYDEAEKKIISVFFRDKNVLLYNIFVHSDSKPEIVKNKELHDWIVPFMNQLGFRTSGRWGFVNVTFTPVNFY